MIRALTLGIAAQAEWHPVRPYGTGDEAIVLVSDREYEDEDGARAESPVPKRFPLVERTGRARCGWFCLFSTLDLSQVEGFVRRFRQDGGGQLRTWEAGQIIPTAEEVMDAAEHVYAAVRHERGGADAFSPDLIVAGFDDQDRPVIFQVGESGKAELRRVPGYATTGSGASHAGPLLYWHDLQPNDPLHQVIYKCWSAKHHAERIVGPTTDVAVMVRDVEEPVDASPGVRMTIEGAMAAIEAPVFAPHRPVEPARWREELEERVGNMLQRARDEQNELWKRHR